MEDNELKNLLKIDFPEIKGDEEKVLAACKARNRKHNKQLTSLLCALSGCVVVVMAIFLSITLVNSRVPNDVVRINNSIINLDKIENEEEKMLEIMKIEKDIEIIPIDKQTKIDMSKLAYENGKTINNLKNSVEWKSTLSQGEEYNELSDYFNFADAYEINMVRSFSSIDEKIDDQNIINHLFRYFDLPFIEIVNNRETFYEDYKEELSGDYKDYYSISLKYYGMDENESIKINLYGSGYVFVVINERIGDETYDVINKFSLVSLVPIDFDRFIRFVSYEIIEIKNIENENATGIMIYYNDELYNSIYDVNLVSKFLDNFKNIKIKHIPTFQNTLSSYSVDFSKEYLEMLEELEDAYMIKVVYVDGEYIFYISNNNYLYVNNSSERWKSTQGIYNLTNILEEINK